THTPAGRIRWALLYGLGLAAAGWLLHSAHDVHRMFIINKNDATPAWCLWSATITTWAWAAVYWLVDVRRARRWTSMLELGGQNALLAYILAPILNSLFALLAAALRQPNPYDALGASFAVGFWRALLFALAVAWLAARLRRAGIQLRV